MNTAMVQGSGNAKADRPAAGYLLNRRMHPQALSEQVAEVRDTGEQGVARLPVPKRHGGRH
jgi:hypothetical protein